MVASSAAHAELQRIWRLVQELSAQLKENQIETEHLRRQAQFLQDTDTEAYAQSGDVSDDAHKDSASQINGHAHAQRQSTLNGNTMHAALLQRHEDTLEENRKLKQELDEVSFLAAEYELGLSAAMDKIRVHEHDVALSVLQLKRRHQEELDRERELTRQAQQQYTSLQHEVQRIQGLVRQAYEAQSDTDRAEMLHVENAALREVLDKAVVQTS